MKQRVVIIVLILLGIALLVVGGIALYKHYCVDDTDSAVEMESVEVPDIQEETHGVIKFQDLELDSRMLGKWQHSTRPTWYRVYTTEPAEDGFCWGREWDTADDIFEEDLTPYGNGWFKWKKDGDYVIELHMTDNRGVSVPFEYKVLNVNDEEMKFKETKDTDRQLFRKCN